MVVIEYIHFISVNISLYVYYYSSTSYIPPGIFMWFSSASTTYKNAVSTSIV